MQRTLEAQGRVLISARPSNTAGRPDAHISVTFGLAILHDKRLNQQRLVSFFLRPPPRANAGTILVGSLSLCLLRKIATESPAPVLQLLYLLLQ